jgi:hypothetical protein
MGTTARFGLHYPELTAEPNVPADVLALATDVEGRLARAFPCLSTARPTGIADGFMIRETDTGLVLIWDGTEWDTVGGSSGGGGGGGDVVTAHAQFSAASAQSVATGNVTCAFGTSDVASALVTRASNGAGHQFTLGATGLWTITATIRWASTSATGERYAGIHIPGASGGTPLAGNGADPPANRPTTLNVALTRNFSSGSAVMVNLFNGTPAARTLEPHASGGWVRINFTYVAAA